jgi:hypothetical protein
MRHHIGLVAREATPNPASWEALEDEMRVVGDALGTAFLRGHWVDIYAIAREMQMRWKYAAPSARDSAAFHAAIRPSGTRLLVTLGAGTTSERSRTSVAHEIGHAFFWNTDLAPPQRFLEYEISPKREEGACWVFARTVLLPREAVDKQGLETPPAVLEDLEIRAKRLRVSVPFLVTRLLLDLDAYSDCVYFDALCRNGERHAGRYVAGPGIDRNTQRGRFLASLRKAANACDPDNSAEILNALHDSGLLPSHREVEWDNGRRDMYWLQFIE